MAGGGGGGDACGGDVCVPTPPCPPAPPHAATVSSAADQGIFVPVLRPEDLPKGERARSRGGAWRSAGVRAPQRQGGAPCLHPVTWPPSQATSQPARQSPTPVYGSTPARTRAHARTRPSHPLPPAPPQACARRRAWRGRACCCSGTATRSMRSRRAPPLRAPTLRASSRPSSPRTLPSVRRRGGGGGRGAVRACAGC